MRNDQGIAKFSKQIGIISRFEESKEADIELAFLVECTPSMSDKYESIEYYIKQIIDNIIAKFPQYTLRLAFVGYKDHTDQNYCLSLLDFTQTHSELLTAIHEIKFDGKSNGTVAMIDGLDCCGKLRWGKASIKQIIHFGYSACPGSEFGRSTEIFSEGCACGRKCQNALENFRQLNIFYIIISYSPDIEKVASVFLKFYSNIKCIPTSPNLPENNILKTILANSDDFDDPSKIFLFMSLPNSVSANQNSGRPGNFLTPSVVQNVFPVRQPPFYCSRIAEASSHQIRFRPRPPIFQMPSPAPNPEASFQNMMLVFGQRPLNAPQRLIAPMLATSTLCESSPPSQIDNEESRKEIRDAEHQKAVARVMAARISNALLSPVIPKANL